MAAEFGRFLVGPQDDGDRIPADDRPNAMLDVAIPVGAFLALRRDRIHVGRVQRGGLGNAGAPCLLGQPLEQVGRASTALMVENCAQRVDPFARLDGVKILHAFHLVLPLAFPRPLLVGPVWQDPCQGAGFLLMRPTPCNCKHSSAPRIAGSFVCAKIRNDDVCNVRKSKSLGGCGSAGYGRITGQRAPRFSDKSHVPSDRSLNGTRFRRIIRNARVRPAS